MGQQGGCRCGVVRFEVEGAPKHSAMCWCAHCRGSSGTPATVWTLFSRDQVSIEGTPATHESSPGKFRQFCATCGTGLFYLNEAIFPGQIDIQGAAFDDRDVFPPQAHIQVAEAPAWREKAGMLPAFARFPGEPD